MRARFPLHFILGFFLVWVSRYFYLLVACDVWSEGAAGELSVPNLNQLIRANDARIARQKELLAEYSVTLNAHMGKLEALERRANASRHREAELDYAEGALANELSRQARMLHRIRFGDADAWGSGAGGAERDNSRWSGERDDDTFKGLVESVQTKDDDVVKFTRVCVNETTDFASTYTPPELRTSVIAVVRGNTEWDVWKSGLLVHSIMKSAMRVGQPTAEVVLIHAADQPPSSTFCKVVGTFYTLVVTPSRQQSAVSSLSPSQPSSDDEQDSQLWRTSTLRRAAAAQLTKGRRIIFAEVGDYFMPWILQRLENWRGPMVFFNTLDSESNYAVPLHPVCLKTHACWTARRGSTFDAGSFVIATDVLQRLGGYPKDEDNSYIASQMLMSKLVEQHIISVDNDGIIEPNSDNWVKPARFSNKHVYNHLPSSARPATTTLDQPFLSIILTYGGGRIADLRIFLMALMLQTDGDWEAILVSNDGDVPEVRELLAAHYAGDRRIRYTYVAKNPQYGHPGREKGVRLSRGKYVLITNEDNYYVPKFVATLRATVTASGPLARIFYFAMIHNHGVYDDQCYITQMALTRTDMGSAVVWGDLARKVGFPFRSYNGDWEYFKACLDQLDDHRRQLVSTMQLGVFFVHN